jgi:phosphoadenosine phosphosulfate reductase
MSLVTFDIMGNKRDKVQIAIDRLRAFEPEGGYYLAFSGGKDSQCIYHLAEMAGVKFDAHYRITSVDPPELVRFIKQQYPQVALDFPRDKDGKVITMWNLILKKLIPPTRLVRYCCESLKETCGKGRIVVTGVRWDESVRRKNMRGPVEIQSKKAVKSADENGAVYKLNGKGGIILNLDNSAERRTVEQCFRTHKTIVNPIIDWLEEDVWEFLNEVVMVPHCCLNDQGYKRLGCIGCPMSHNRERELERYPKHRAAYLRAFARMLNERDERGMGGDAVFFRSPEGVMDWYLEKVQAVQAKAEGQIDIEELMEVEP